MVTRGPCAGDALDPPFREISNKALFVSLSLSLSLYTHTHTYRHTSISTGIRVPVCVARDVDRRLRGSVETVHEDAELDLGGVGSGWLSADGDDAEALVRILPHTSLGLG